MNLRIENRDGVVLVRIDEVHVGANVADELRSRVLEALPASAARLVLDLTKVDFLDSSGLGALVSLLKAARPAGDVVLFGLRPSVAEILRLTHLDAVFRCEEREDQALARVSADTSTG